MRSITLGLAALALAAAGTAPRWSATLAPMGGSQVGGKATLEAVGTDSARATVQVTGAKPGSKLGWAISQGACQAKGKALGSADFPAIATSATGQGAATATLAAAPPADGALSVTVFASNGGSTAVACGMFKPEAAAAGDSGVRP